MRRSAVLVPAVVVAGKESSLCCARRGEVIVCRDEGGNMGLAFRIYGFPCFSIREKEREKYAVAIQGNVVLRATKDTMAKWAVGMAV